MPKHPTDSIIVKTRKTTTELNKKSNSKNIQNNNKQTKCSDDVSREGIEVVGKKRKSSEELVDKAEECRNFREEKDKKIEEVGEAIVVDEDKKILNYIEEEEEYREMDYCLMLNRVLPDSIRAMGWNEVTPEFSSRFSCAYRKYRYFFIKRNLDIEKMSEATNRLIGDHDFRNICKIDIAKVSNFEREIYSANIVPFQIDMIHPELSVYMLEIQGIAFLWHMVRCIMSLLFMIGEGYEDLNIIDILLDIEVTPAKPHYKMAPDLPLVLHECGFDNMKMHYQPSVLWTLTSHYEELWSKHMIACARAKNALESLKSWEVRKDDVENFITYITDKKKSINDRKSGYKKNDKEKQNSDKSADKDFMLLKADQSSDLIQNTGNKNENDGGILIVCEKSNTDIDFNDMESANMELEEHSLISSLENQNMIWSEVLILLASKYDLLPTKDLLPHVPLTQVRIV